MSQCTARSARFLLSVIAVGSLASLVGGVMPAAAADSTQLVPQITTIAGSAGNNDALHTSMRPGNGPWAEGLAIDRDKLYISDDQWGVVRRVDLTTGAQQVVAGNGVDGYSGDGGPATRAALFDPEGVAVDRRGDVFVSDGLLPNRHIREVTPGGGIRTFAGTGKDLPFNGDGKATDVNMGPDGMATEPDGDLIVADYTTMRIRRITPDGVVTTVAGNGNSPTTPTEGDGGPATEAPIGYPLAVLPDPSGGFWFSTLSYTIRHVDAQGVITTAAGTGTRDYPTPVGDGGPAKSAEIDEALGLATDGHGTLWFTENTSDTIREITPTGTLETVVGTLNTSGFAGDGGPATQALLNGPAGLVRGSDGSLYVADSLNDRVRRVSPEGAISTVAGTGTNLDSGNGGRALDAQFYAPSEVITDPQGDIYVSELLSGAIRKITPDGMVQTVAGAGTGPAQDSGDGGPASAANVSLPSAMVWHDGSLYFTDGDRVRRVDPHGVISTFAGNGQGTGSGPNVGPSAYGDGGPAVDASLALPSGLAFDSAGDLVISDSDHARIRKVDHTSGIITTLYGNGTGEEVFGAPAQNNGIAPNDLLYDDKGDLFVSQYGLYDVVEITAGGTLERYAGTGARGYTGDGGPASSADLFGPTEMTWDPGGNLLICDRGNHVVRSVNPTSGIISTVIGDGDDEFSGDGGLASEAGVRFPGGITRDPAGRIIVADQTSGRIRAVTLVDPSQLVTGVGPQWSSLPGRPPFPAAGAAFAPDKTGGGVIALAPDAMTWRYTHNTWTQLHPATSPPARVNAAMTWDASDDEVVLFGGTGTNGVDLADTWTWNGATWAQTAAEPAPPARHSAALGWTPRGGTILFGGANSAVTLGDTWIFNSGSWSPDTSGPGPSARFGAAVAESPFAGREFATGLVLFGGTDATGVVQSDTWIYNLGWEQVAFPGPSARTGAAMAYDNTDDRTLLFGGTTSNGPATDTWEWNGNNWRVVPETTRPTATGSALVADDSLRGAVLLGADATWRIGDTPLSAIGPGSDLPEAPVVALLPVLALAAVAVTRRRRITGRDREELALPSL